LGWWSHKPNDKSSRLISLRVDSIFSRIARSSQAYGKPRRFFNAHWDHEPDMRAERQTLLPLPFRGETAGVRGPSLLGAQAGFVEGWPKKTAAPDKTPLLRYQLFRFSSFPKGTSASLYRPVHLRLTGSSSRAAWRAGHWTQSPSFAPRGYSYKEPGPEPNGPPRANWAPSVKPARKSIQPGRLPPMNPGPAACLRNAVAEDKRSRMGRLAGHRRKLEPNEQRRPPRWLSQLRRMPVAKRARTHNSRHAPARWPCCPKVSVQFPGLLQSVSYAGLSLINTTPSSIFRKAPLT